MKPFFTIAAALLPIIFFGQGRVSLSFKTDDKPSVHGFSYWQEVRVTSKDTCFVTRIHRANPDNIHNLKQGKYILEFVSVFNHTFKKKIGLTKKTPVLTVKGLQSFYSPAPETESLVLALKENDTLFILYSTNADERATEKIAVTRTKAGYKAIQFEGVGSSVKQQMIFRDEFFSDITKFETKCREANSPKAESSPRAEMYTFELNRRLHTFIVPQDAGFNALKSKLFIVEKK